MSWICTQTYEHTHTHQHTNHTLFLQTLFLTPVIEQLTSCLKCELCISAIQRALHINRKALCNSGISFENLSHTLQLLKEKIMNQSCWILCVFEAIAKDVFRARWSPEILDLCAIQSETTVLSCPHAPIILCEQIAVMFRVSASAKTDWTSAAGKLSAALRPTITWCLFIFCLYADHMYTPAHIMRQGGHIADKRELRNFRGTDFYCICPFFRTLCPLFHHLCSLCLD